MQRNSSISLNHPKSSSSGSRLHLNFIDWNSAGPLTWPEKIKIFQLPPVVVNGSCNTSCLVIASIKIAVCDCFLDLIILRTVIQLAALSLTVHQLNFMCHCYFTNQTPSKVQFVLNSAKSFMGKNGTAKTLLIRSTTNYRHFYWSTRLDELNLPNNYHNQIISNNSRRRNNYHIQGDNDNLPITPVTQQPPPSSSMIGVR